MGRKLSPHSLRPNGGAPLLIRAGCAALKSVDDMGLLLEAQIINPAITTIARFMAPNITAEQLRHLHPRDAAAVWLNAYMDKYNLNPHLRHPKCYIEGPNEPVWATHADMEWYGQFEAERVFFLKAIGLRACVGNFSTGVPHIAVNDTSWWQSFLPALYAIRDNGGRLGIHAYSSGDLTQDPANILRYRQIHDLVLVPRGLGSVRIDITEFGRLDFASHVSPEQYLAEMLAIDAEFDRDSYLEAATIFTFGSTNPAWDTYNVDGTVIPQRLAEHILVAPPPPPPVLRKGARIVVTADIGLRVRSAPVYTPNNVIYVQPLNAMGVIVDGPVNQSGIAWWRVDYDQGRDGWSSGAYLKALS